MAQVNKQTRWYRAVQNQPRESGWYPVNYITPHPGVMFGQPGMFEKYWDADAEIWRVAGPDTPQSDMGVQPNHEWADA